MGRKSFLFFLLLFICIVFALGDISALFAQDADTEEEFTLEEITVTAQKREENQQKVPIAMEVISAEEIQELGKNDIDEILYGISNAIIEKAQDGYRITIRGITDNSEAFKGQSMAAPAVAMNLDGVYSNRKDTGSGLFDIERVEVLYGPQSTMYSSSSPGGIVNIITAQPKTDKYEVSGSLEYGNYELLHTEGAMNAPLGSKAALRASFSTSLRGPYLDNGSDNEDSKSARLRVLLQPTNKFSFTLTGEFSRNQGHGFGGGVEPFGDEDDVDNPWTGAESDTLSANDQRTKKVYGQVEWDMVIGSISLTPSFSKRGGTSESTSAGGGGGGPPPMAFGGFGGSLVPAQAETGTQTVSTQYREQSAEEKGIEFRMSSPTDFLFQWIAGATYYRSEDSQQINSSEYLETGEGAWSKRTMTNKNKAFFANVTYPITDTFRLTGGYRKSDETMISDNEEVRGSLDPAEEGELEYALEHMEQSTGGSPDYKVGIQYDIGEDSMLYADYSTSYRVRGMSMGSEDPEKLKAYTVGAKNRFFGNKLQVNAAAYYYDYKNYRAGGNDITVWLWDLDDDLVADGDERFREPYASGTGDGRMIGVDVSTNWIITSKDMLNLSVSYIDSAWTDLYFDYYYTYSLEVIDGELVQVPLEDADYNGKPMMSTPPWSINLTYAHNFMLPNGGTVKTNLYVKYRTEYNLSWRESDYPYNFQENYHMEDFNAVYAPSDGKWSLSAYVKNIFNYAEKRMIMNMGGAKGLSIGNPRTYGAVLTLRIQS